MSLHQQRDEGENVDTAIFWRHEVMAVRMATLTACHHSAQKKPAATHAATQTTVTNGEQAPVFEYVTPALGLADFLEPLALVECMAPTPDDTYASPATGYLAPPFANFENVHKISGDQEHSFQVPGTGCVLEFLREVDHFNKTLGTSTGGAG